MLIHENEMMENAAMDEALCICVPVSLWKPEVGELEITAYRNVWDICADYEIVHGDDPFDGSALSELCDKVEPIAEKMGYSMDRKNNRPVMEYSLTETNNAIKTYAEKASIIHSTKEVAEFSCLCLHKPETAEDGFDACAVIICDNAVCAVAGINDFSDDDSYEIYVETARDYRERGYASSAVSALSEYLISKGCTVSYKCGADNKASIAVAEKLGMKLCGCRYDAVCYAE